MSTPEISSDAKALLLLTSRLIIARRGRRNEVDITEPLATRELNTLLDRLDELGAGTSELIMPGYEELLRELRGIFDIERLRGLLGRGLKMSLAIDRWQQRGIWVLCREDDGYPGKLIERLAERAPPVLYGCGDRDLFEFDGLGIQGSRNAKSDALQYAYSTGQQTAANDFVVITGGAKGVDQAAMTGVLDADGKAIGVLSDGLSRAAISSVNRLPIMESRLTLVSPFDPDAGFNVGNAMGRNKLIFALSRAGLAVEAAFDRGGTWAGATEQLKRLKFVPMFVRATGTPSRGLDELGDLGALPWPDPRDAKATASVFDQIRSGAYKRTLTSRCPRTDETPAGQVAMLFDSAETFGHSQGPAPQPIKDVSSSHSERLFEAVRPILLDALHEPKGLTQIAEDLDTAKGQTSNWLKRLVEEHKVCKLKNPTRYVATEP